MVNSIIGLSALGFYLVGKLVIGELAILTYSTLQAYFEKNAGGGGNGMNQCLRNG